jgi:ribosomal protein S1
MGMLDKAKVGEKISVLLERLEDKKGEVLVSASKAQKIQGWDKLVEAYDKNEPIMGKITGKVNKVTDNFVFLEVPGLKSEPILDINELKSMGMLEKAKVGETISVLLERLEDKKGEVLVSASKAQKIQGWDKLVEAYEKNEPIMGKITGRVKGGCIVEHIDTGSLMFLPGSQISDKPLKDISHLMNEPQKNSKNYLTHNSQKLKTLKRVKLLLAQ